jgi:2,3-bisphosphoglycerate-independent phosphoglycerate mutase
MNLEFLRELIIPASTKIAMIVLDGLGGLPLTPDGKTELETARTPNLDALAARSALGLCVPLGPGITVESGPGHLALFGYDPLRYRIGRGVLEALGIEFDLQPNDVAARGNFCTMNDAGIVTDRRAGRIPTEASKDLARLLTMRIDDVEIFVEVVKEHRLAIVLRGTGLGAAVSGSDPLKNGAPPHPVRALDADSDKTARVVNQFIERARQLLADKSPANMLLVRGLDRYPNFPAFPEVFGLRAAAIAIAPTYRGIARLVGMHILPVNGSTFADEFATLEQHWNDFDFFYLHIKNTDLAGEDGDFARKVRVIEEVDALLPRLCALEPDVVIVGGDHSTPAVLRAHSWHPVPVLLYSPTVRADGIAEFGERACARGSLGVLPAQDLMPLALAHAQRIEKFSA